jgi:hypothetical protein
LEEINVAEDNADYKDAIEHPKWIAVKSSTNFTAGKDSVYVSADEVKAVKALADRFAAFYDGLNSWSRVKTSWPRKWKPAKPQAPNWNSTEMEIMALFMQGGWKFANSWKFGSIRLSASG